MKTLNLIEYEQLRPEHAKFVRQVHLDPAKNKIIVAPVKSGKRTMKILITQLTKQNEYNFYVSSLNRKDERDQLKELKAYGMDIFVCGVDDIEAFVSRVRSEAQSIPVNIHFNESDYGTDKNEILGQAKFQELMNLPNVRIWLYSATNHEAELALAGRNDKKVFRFNPPSTYRGASWFLSNNLVTDSSEFWDFANNCLTPQGQEACDLLRSSEKLFGVVRFASFYKEIKNNSAFTSTMENHYGFDLRFVAGDEGFDWMHDYKRYAYDFVSNKKLKVLIVICQTCTRSTEIGFHKHLSFWHDHRSNTTPFNTIIQAAQRVNHFYNGTDENNIRVYTDLTAWKLNAGLITIDEYTRKLSGRTVAINTSLGTNYDITIHAKLPTDAEILARCKTIGFTPKQKIKKTDGSLHLYKMHNHCKDHKANDIASGVAKNRPFASHIDKPTIIELDGPSPSFPDSWLLVPHLHNKFVLFLPLPVTVNIASGVQHHASDKSIYV
jgi:hypothetical protein